MCTAALVGISWYIEVCMEIFGLLRSAANPEQAIPMSAYMRHQFAFLGIPTPDRRKLCQNFLKAQNAIDWLFIFRCWEQLEREYQ